MNKILGISLEKIDEIDNIYLLEYRKYEGENFKHYRAFFVDANSVFMYFEKYINDEEIDTKNWLDVTEEFDE